MSKKLFFDNLTHKGGIDPVNKIALLFLTLILLLPIQGQGVAPEAPASPEAVTPSAPPPGATPGAAAPPSTPGASTPSTVAPSDPAAGPAEPLPPAENKAKGSKQSISGFDGINWGTTYKDVKEKFRTLAAQPNENDNVEIVADTPDREILIKRRDIFYRYVFYKKPESKIVDSMVKSQEPAAAKLPEKDPTAGTARFFFVESSFPLLVADDVYKKLSEKYGERTGNTVAKEQRGAFVWNNESDEGFLFQWVEPYARQGYTRSIYYLSRKIREEIKSDLQLWQFVRELKAIEALVK